MAESACQSWLQSTKRYELLTHLPDIGRRHNKHWFLLKDGNVSFFLHYYQKQIVEICM